MPEPSRAGSEETKGGYNDKKENRKPSSERCPLCRNSHNLDVCERFNKMFRARKNGSCEVASVDALAGGTAGLVLC